MAHGSPAGSAPDLLERIDTARLYAEADLLSGAERLRATGRTEELREITAAVEPAELSVSARGPWLMLRADKAPTLPSWVHTYGMGIGSVARVAARKVLALAEARRAYDQALSDAAAALEAMGDESYRSCTCPTVSIGVPA
jgi:hypothetical protein